MIKVDVTTLETVDLGKIWPKPNRKDENVPFNKKETEYDHYNSKKMTKSHHPDLY